MRPSLDYKDLAFITYELGVILTAALTGTRNPSEVETWLHGVAPSDEQIIRLNFACEIFKEVSASQGTNLTRSWFIGANVGDNDDSPVTAIREDRFDEVKISATRMIEDQWQ